ncbi:DUF2326 domain-containing protein [Vibrio anguillarum]|uniref:DUF2326 domain-containing protein n=3 Tax=Vibrio anguillarum TaxID=55601 RepID=UPI000BB51450|nr:DUF2326 domain-containing protein [Vibrio anguillarum]ATC60049.1 hypothetical protein CMV05_21805 [Vibrio anguillarum]MBF4340785.1 DUF2326 domain-containing protein [Vibrio anguillarum]
MKISKIYSNKPDIFEPIEFNEGFNVIIGQIRLRDDKNKDSHNLGKSKLAELIDFGFLKKRHKETFLFKHMSRFTEFVFFFEVKLNDGTYLTIRRSVEKNTQIFFKKHSTKFQDYRFLEDSDWDYPKLAYDKAKLLLDSFLNLTSISPWDYRMAVSYALRKQDDFNDIFQLKKFGRGKDLSWKPYIGHILGFNAENLKNNYELKASIEKVVAQLADLQKEIGLYQGDEEEMLQDALSLKSQDAEALQEQLDILNFDDSDTEAVEELSENIDEEIEELNRVRYYLKSDLKKLRRAESKQPVSFNTDKTKKLFTEAGILFGDQIKKSYDELLEFNKKITVERTRFVKLQTSDLEQQIMDISSRLTELNTLKSRQVSFLTSTDSFEKYKEVSKRLLLISTEINSIRRKLEISEQIKERKSKSRTLSNQKNDVIEKIRVDRDSVMQSETSIYKSIKENFTTFVKLVLDKDGRISTEQNGEGNLVYHAGFVDGEFNYTSESDGCSYKKILCIGYDLAVNLAYVNKDFVRFIYHDGGLETLDTRKKLEFLNYARSIPELFGTQYILTLIDSDLPDGVEFTDEEIALTLHDNGDNGLLFKMPSW